MKIEILCGEGSTNGVHLSDIYGRNGRVGVGGSELALLTMCEGWSKNGHEVILYNNPRSQDGVFEQRNTKDFNKSDKRDVLIIFRQPTPKVVEANGKKVFWSCDQYTTGDFRHFAQFVESIVTISPFHAKYFAQTYEIRETVTIDLPVRSDDYLNKVEKVPYRIIFTSVPDRGLEIVANTFPEIKRQVRDASIVITSDYRLWGSPDPLNQRYSPMFIRMEGVQFLGAIPRERLVLEQQRAQIHYYPFSQKTADELFCIAVAESQFAGVLPITSTDGALETTNMGVLVSNSANSPEVQKVFIDKVVEYITNPSLPELQKKVMDSARKRFSIEKIMKDWDEKVFNGC